MAQWSPKQTRALGGGRRLGFDPYFELERMRMEQEYAQQPIRLGLSQQAARDVAQQSQFGQQMSFQERQREGQERQGYIGAAGNLAATGMMMNYMQGKPVLGEWGGGYKGVTTKGTTPTTTPYKYGEATGLGATAPAFTTGAEATGASTYTAAQASTLGVAEGATYGGTAAEGFGYGAGEGVSGSAMGGGYAGGAGTYAVQGIAASYAGSEIGKSRIGEQTMVGGKSERSVIGGAAAGAAYGTMIYPGIGTVVGAVIGGAIGYLNK